MPTQQPPQELSSNRPYLFRAIYEWLTANQQTPHIRINDTQAPGVRVPPQFHTGNPLILNIAKVAVADLVMANEGISFSARFNGRQFEIYVPMDAIAMLYGRESGAGMLFPDEDFNPEPEKVPELADQDAVVEETVPEPRDPNPDPRRAHLRVVK
jgi:stringent starvation protein B